MKNINEYFKDIDLWIIFLIKFMKKEKTINYFDNFFYIFYKNHIKTFIKWFIIN